MKIKLTVLLICLVSVLNAQSLLDLKVDVAFLASDLLEGRSSGSVGEALASDYIINRFNEIGLSPAGENNTWTQHFEFPEVLNVHGTTSESDKLIKGNNVIGLIQNHAKKTIILGAHYDHLGYTHSGSRYTGGEAIHNGADDNASGVAAMLYVAEYLHKHKVEDFNYLFIAFSGEEYGLFGSKYFTQSPTIVLGDVACMINLDMVGRMNKENTLVVNGVGTSPIWKPLLEEVKENLNITTTESGIGPSDHTSFYLKDIPVVHLFTGQHMDYHKPSDDPFLVNYLGLEEVSKFITRLIMNMDAEAEIQFTKTKDNEERKAAKFKVSLGVMPDYTYSGEGMRIDGVIEGRTAQEAGLQDGDIIIKLGETVINDIYDYMDALSTFKSGQETEVIVKRGSKTEKKVVTF